MTTISRSRPHRRGPKLFGYLLLLLILCGVLFVWRSPAAGLLWRGLTPILQFRAGMGGGSDLEAQLASTTALLADRNLLYQENLDLESRLARDGSTPTILAGVIARPPAIPYDTLIIDAGSQEGIQDGDLVAAAGSVIIGSISQVYATTARVELLSAPGESMSALLLHPGSQPVPLMLEGQGGGSLTTQVPAGTLATPGDPIVLQGIAGGLPGAIAAVETPTGSTFEHIYVSLPVNPLTLQFVEVRPQEHAQ